MSTDNPTTAADITEQASNVLLIVDAETLLARYPAPNGDPDTPFVIDDGFIFGFGVIPSAEPGGTNGSLALPASAAPVFHLRGRTVGLYAEHSVVIYDLRIGEAGVLAPPQLVAHSQRPLFSPNPQAPTEPLMTQADDHYWRCQPLSAGVEPCELSFMLVDSNCEALGYFKWLVELQVPGEGSAA
ncbi:AidA/PixA family protein [Jeongeupia wiesaeckerbachi]|uniref:AidA/PixA family protein n=1 Tax=Jeongeupia wiesaeckerbachi TaxID=3051218 RepID=UPI003D809E8A